MGFVLADIAKYAYNGEQPFNEKLSNLRLMMLGQSSYIHLVAREDSPINSVNDFKGRRIAAGAPGSSISMVVIPGILKAYGLSYDDVNKYFLNMKETTDALSDKTVDIGVYFAGIPAAGVSELATSRNIKLISIDQEAMTRILKNFPFLHSGVIKSGTYKNVNKDINVIGVRTAILTSSEVPEDTIYQILKAVHSHQDEWKQIHPGAEEFKPEVLAREYAGIMPLHPGAEKYLKEIGLIK